MTMYGSSLPFDQNGGCPSCACTHVSSDHEVEMWLSLVCASNCIIELSHWKNFRSCLPVEIISALSTECRCHTTSSQGHAVSCVSRSRLCWAHALLAATLREGSQVRCILRPLLVRTLPGAVHPSGSRRLLVVELSNDVPQVR